MFACKEEWGGGFPCGNGILLGRRVFSSARDFFEGWKNKEALCAVRGMRCFF